MQTDTTSPTETKLKPKDACWSVNKIYCGEVLEKLKARQDLYLRQTGKELPKVDAINFCILGI
jgi:hypothetical protein